MKLVEPIRPSRPADCIVTGLRNIIELIESGELGLLTSAVVVVGHTGEDPGPDANTSVLTEQVQVFGLGPRHDAFTVRGLMMTGLMEHHFNTSAG